MRGWSSIALGLLLIGVAFWLHATDGFGTSWALMFGVAGLFMLVRGAQGLAVGEAGDPMPVVDFVTDPAGAIVDTAVERVGGMVDNQRKNVSDGLREWLKPAASADAAAEPAFDPDAVIARYLEQRVAPPPAEAAPAAPVRGFGRKGL